MSVGILLEVNWHWIGRQLTSDWLSIGIWLDVNWRQIGCQLAFDWMSIGVRLDVNWHLIGCQLSSDWMSIGIWLDVNWHRIGSQFASGWQLIGIPLEVNWHLIGSQLEFDWQSIGIRLGVKSIGLDLNRHHSRLTLQWSRIGSQLVANWYTIGSQILMKGDFWIQLDWHCIDLHLVRIWNQYFSIGFSLPIEILFSIGRGLVMHCPELAQHWHSGTPANRTNPMQMLQSFTNREKAPDENRQHWQRIGECRPD